MLIALFGVANVYLIKQTSPPLPSSTSLTVEVIGHQFWWEVRYPGTPVITANEIHIPSRTRVNVVALTADVIHSFWVPALNRKVDMVPGRRNRVLLYASQPGTYRGQCSQFCGFQHAHMAFQVIAQPPAAFRRWLASAGAPAAGGAATSTAGLAARTGGAATSTGASAAGSSAASGRQLFMTRQCASCHRLAGTSAQGFIGPDLTHLAARRWLAALTIPNTPRWLTAWIANPQAIKPGARMPDLGLSRSDIASLVAYLETLR